MKHGEAGNVCLLDGVIKKQGEKTAPGASVFSPCLWVRIVGPALGPAARRGPFLFLTEVFLTGVQENSFFDAVRSLRFLRSLRSLGSVLRPFVLG